jgi:hypothetical protein
MGVGWQWNGTMVVGGTPMAWCSGEGGGKIETQLNDGESDECWDNLFIVVEGGNRVVRGGWPTTMVWIQCFSFDLRGKATGQSVTRRWSGGSELVLASWEGSVTLCDGVATSDWGETTPRREKGGDDTSWVDVNLIGPKNEENPRDRLSYYKWMKI